MKIKTVLGLLGVWISISAIVAFYVTASLTLSAQSERDYNALLDNAANNHAASVQLYITALQGSFASLSETLSQTDDRTEQNAMIIAYAENRSNVAFIGINRFLERVGDWNDDYDRDAMSARAVNLPQSGNVYLFAFNDNPPTRDYGLAMCAPIGNDRNNTLIVVYYSDVINNMNDTVSLPADGKFALYDSGGNVTCGNRLGAIDERGMTIRRADIADTGWQAAAVGDVKSVRNIAGDALDGLLILTVALCVGGIIATFLICRKFANPLVVIAKAGEQFRRGDFTVRMEFSGGNARN
ncbi:MAG: hypothetical protein FWG45_07830, partial [Oscillospiraceae bacterium]|nr:hypothetical protein [Oscillospiraceae bacterium]